LKVAIKARSGRAWLIDETEVAQRFCFLGVLSIFNQQHAVWPINIALVRTHGRLNMFDLVAVPLPYFGGADTCHWPTLLKPMLCAPGSGLNPDFVQELALLSRIYRSYVRG